MSPPFFTIHEVRDHLSSHAICLNKRFSVLSMDDIQGIFCVSIEIQTLNVTNLAPIYQRSVAKSLFTASLTKHKESAQSGSITKSSRIKFQCQVCYLITEASSYFFMSQGHCFLILLLGKVIIYLTELTWELHKEMNLVIYFRANDYLERSEHVVVWMRNDPHGLAFFTTWSPAVDAV